jgi:hypothetical protein
MHCRRIADPVSLRSDVLRTRLLSLDIAGFNLYLTVATQPLFISSQIDKTGAPTDACTGISFRVASYPPAHISLQFE